MASIVAPQPAGKAGRRSKSDASLVRDRVARPGLSLVPRHHRDRLDRHLVLLRRARQPPERAGAGRGQGRGRERRVVGDPRRRLLPDPQVPGRPAEASEAAALVQVGGVLDVAVRLRAPLHRLLLGRAAAADRPLGRRPRPVAGDPDLDRAARRRVARLRRPLPRARRPSAALRARDARPRHRDRLRGRAALPAARGVPPGRLDARDDHGRERPLRDHPRPLGARPREGGRARARPEAGPPRQAALGAQQLPDAAGALHDARRALVVHLHARPRLGGARRADGRRRGDPPLLHPPARGRDALVDPGRLRVRDRGDRGLAEAGRHEACEGRDGRDVRAGGRDRPGAVRAVSLDEPDAARLHVAAGGRRPRHARADPRARGADQERSRSTRRSCRSATRRR